MSSISFKWLYEQSVTGLLQIAQKTSNKPWASSMEKDLAYFQSNATVRPVPVGKHIPPEYEANLLILEKMQWDEESVGRAMDLTALFSFLKKTSAQKLEEGKTQFDSAVLKSQFGRGVPVGGDYGMIRGSGCEVCRLYNETTKKEVGAFVSYLATSLKLLENIENQAPFQLAVEGLQSPILDLEISLYAKIKARFLEMSIAMVASEKELDHLTRYCVNCDNEMDPVFWRLVDIDSMQFERHDGDRENPNLQTE